VLDVLRRVAAVPLEKELVVVNDASRRLGLAAVEEVERDPRAVLEDVADGYVSVERARRDYGVVVREVDADLAEYELDEAATAAERKQIAAERRSWLEEDPAAVAERYRAGQVDQLDVIRRHGVILDWGTGELLVKTTEQFRAMLRRRTVSHWSAG